MSYLLLSTISGQKIGALSYTDGDTLPNHFANGLPYESDGTLAVAIDGAISHYHQGLPFTASGRLAGTLSETPTRFGGGAAPFSASGHLTLGSSGVTHYSGGICYTESGSIGSSAGGPPLIQRYFTQLDGQSKFFRRETPWACVDPVVEITFLGNTAPTTYFLFDGVDATDRAFLYANANNGLLNTNAATIELNSAIVSNAAVAAVVGELNKVIVTFSGSYRLQTLGARFSQNSLFAPTIISSIKLIDPADTANTFNYPMDKNLPYELPDGVESLELWDDPASEIESGWVYNGNGSYTRSAAGNDSAIGNNIAFVSGQAVNITLTIDSIDVGGFKVSAQGGASVNVPSTSGVHTVQCIAGASGTTKVSGTTASTRGSVSGVSIKVASALIFENGSVDGSDRLLVTKKEDGTGFVGETGIEYDYATGAAPVDSYGTEYSTAYS